MSGSNVGVSELPTGVLLAVGALVLIQLSLQVIALVQLVKTPSDRVTIGGRKWIWALIIVFGELIGAIVWFAAGRTPAGVAEPGPASAETDRQRAVDTLYGREGDA